MNEKIKKRDFLWSSLYWTSVRNVRETFPKGSGQQRSIGHHAQEDIREATTEALLQLLLPQLLLQPVVLTIEQDASYIWDMLIRSEKVALLVKVDVKKTAYKRNLHYWGWLFITCSQINALQSCIVALTLISVRGMAVSWSSPTSFFIDKKALTSCIFVLLKWRKKKKKQIMVLPWHEWLGGTN